MNAPENIAPMNAAHGVLLNAKDALSVMDVARSIGASKPTAQKQLKESAGLGLIEMEPRAGGTPFYRLIVAGDQPPQKRDETRAAAGAEGGDQIESTEPKADMGNPITEGPPLDFATSPELQYLAPEDYETAAADQALLAIANRELADQIEEKNHTLRSQARVLIDLRAQVSDQGQSIDSLTKDVINTRAALNKAINEADRLRAELATERQAREALQEQDDAVDVTEAAVGYLVRAPKRKPRLVTKPERAREAALAAVRAGAGRAEVLAVVPVGVARRGAEWQESGPRSNGD